MRRVLISSPRLRALARGVAGGAYKPVPQRVCIECGVLSALMGVRGASEGVSRVRHERRYARGPRIHTHAHTRTHTYAYKHVHTHYAYTHTWRYTDGDARTTRAFAAAHRTTDPARTAGSGARKTETPSEAAKREPPPRSLQPRSAPVYVQATKWAVGGGDGDGER